MSEEIDLHKLIELLDAALVSKDENVKKALRKFLFIAALALDNGDEREMGPIEAILRGLETRIADLERANTYSQPFGKQDWYGPHTYPGTVPGPSYPTTTPNLGGYWATNTSGATAGNSFTATSYSQAISGALSELEQLKTAYATQHKSSQTS